MRPSLRERSVNLLPIGLRAPPASAGDLPVRAGAAYRPPYRGVGAATRPRTTARALATTQCCMDAATARRTHPMALRDRERFPQFAERHRIVAEVLAATTMQRHERLAAHVDGTGAWLRWTAVAVEGGSRSEGGTGGPVVCHVLARLSPPAGSPRGPAASTDHTRALAVAFHGPAAGRPRPADPGCTRCRKGTGSLFRLAACAPHAAAASRAIAFGCALA